MFAVNSPLEYLELFFSPEEKLQGISEFSGTIGLKLFSVGCFIDMLSLI